MAIVDVEIAPVTYLTQLPTIFSWQSKTAHLTGPGGQIALFIEVLTKYFCSFTARDVYTIFSRYP